MRDAEKEADDAASALRQVESQIENAAPAKSEFGKARDAYRKAKAAYEAAKKKALEDPDYKAKLEELTADGGSGTALRKVTLDTDPNVKAALEKLNDAKSKYETLCMTVFGSNARWKAASAKLKAKNKAVADMQHQVAEAKKNRSAARQALRNTEATIAAGGAYAKQKAREQAAMDKVLRQHPELKTLQTSPPAAALPRVKQDSAAKDSPVLNDPPAADDSQQ